MDKDYWYTAKDGKKVHVEENETPLEAYNRTYPDGIQRNYIKDKKFYNENGEVNPVNDAGEPIDEVFDADYDVFEESKLSEEEQRVVTTQNIINEKLSKILDNPSDYFSKNEIEKIKHDAFFHGVDYELYLKKVAFKMATGVSKRAAIKFTFDDFTDF